MRSEGENDGAVNVPRLFIVNIYWIYYFRGGEILY